MRWDKKIDNYEKMKMNIFIQKKFYFNLNGSINFFLFQF